MKTRSLHHNFQDLLKNYKVKKKMNRSNLFDKNLDLYNLVVIQNPLIHHRLVC